jgi:anti-sigma regulatory factor (Ser/Thr protein kinase)
MAVITARFPAAEKKDLVVIRRFTEAVMTAFGVDQEVVPELVLAVHEAAANILNHGYKNRPGCIAVEFALVGDDLKIRLLDQAPIFDPTTAPTPDVSIPLGQRPYGGLGIHMMRSFADELRYRVTDEDENELVLVKFDAIQT